MSNKIITLQSLYLSHNPGQLYVSTPDDKTCLLVDTLNVSNILLHKNGERFVLYSLSNIGKPRDVIDIPWILPKGLPETCFTSGLAKNSTSHLPEE